MCQKQGFDSCTHFNLLKQFAFCQVIDLEDHGFEAISS